MEKIETIKEYEFLDFYIVEHTPLIALMTMVL